MACFASFQHADSKQVGPLTMAMPVFYHHGCQQEGNRWYSRGKNFRVYDHFTPEEKA